MDHAESTGLQILLKCGPESEVGNSEPIHSSTHGGFGQNGSVRTLPSQRACPFHIAVDIQEISKTTWLSNLVLASLRWIRLLPGDQGGNAQPRIFQEPLINKLRFHLVQKDRRDVEGYCAQGNIGLPKQT